MRKHGLLWPYWQYPLPPANLHTSQSPRCGHIATDQPNEASGTDGIKVQSVVEELVWIFAAVEHSDVMCVGTHVTKVGDRLTALEPISQQLPKYFGSIEVDVSRGLWLRMDYGSQ
ncbi:MAG: hypothetical protein V3Q69_07980 [Burkholderia sp.]